MSTILIVYASHSASSISKRSHRIDILHFIVSPFGSNIIDLGVQVLIVSFNRCDLACYSLVELVKLLVQVHDTVVQHCN